MKHFRTIFILAILMLLGCAVLPLIDVAEQPRERQGRKLTVTYSWPGASAKVVEQNVTSRLEGLVSAVKGVESTESESRFGGGSIVVQLKPQTPVSAAKFEILSLLRQTYRQLPEGVEYPDLQGGEVVTGSGRREKEMLLLSYRVVADMTGRQLGEYVEQSIERRLAALPEVKRVEVTGAREKYIEIRYDPVKLAVNGVSAADIERAISAFSGREEVAGMAVVYGAGGPEKTVVRLSTEPFAIPLEEMPVKKTGGKTIYLNDLATFDYRDKLPDSYYRVNGQSTVFLNIYIEADADKVRTSRSIREALDEISEDVKEGVALELDHDAASEAESQLSSLIWRSSLALLILLLFVWIVSRSARYLAVITVALAANVLIAAFCYWILDIRLHVYSLAGITVSLGMIIDATVVMADHYGYYRDRKAFLAILAALLTTIGSLVVVLWLPEPLRHDMYDFSLIIMVNLTVALVVAYLFTPALIEVAGYSARQKRRFSRRRRRAVRWKRFYTGYVRLTQKHKWIPVTLLVLSFGLPFHLLPYKWGQKDMSGFHEVRHEEKEWYASLYDSTLGSREFQAEWKPWLSKVFGGAWRLFSKSLNEQRRMTDENQKKTLHITARMPLGGSVHELNDKVLELETFLTQFDKIERFETHVESWGATVDVVFSEEVSLSGFPYQLENKVIGKIISIGGAEWSTHGVSRPGFSNSLNLRIRSYRIEVMGYNYDRLYRIAEDIYGKISGNPRIVDVTIETPGYEYQEDEFYMVYDKEKMALYDFNLADAHSALASTLTGKWIGEFRDSHLRADMYMKPAGEEEFDIWHLENSQLHASDSTDVKFNDFMRIERREAKNVIPKKNQEYVLRVAFNILGSDNYAKNYMKNLVESTNAVLPVGYRCRDVVWDSSEDEAAPYFLLLLVVVVIFFITAILFESFTIPLTILSLVPFTFIGAFLTYALTGVPFGSGGYAALVLLAGLTVNAGIYIVSEYRGHLRRGVQPARAYVKAYNHKIAAVFLTILSTVLGLIPFFIDGKDEPFWFSFAVGTSGGLLFSVVALVFFMPVCLRLSSGKRRKK